MMTFFYLMTILHLINCTCMKLITTRQYMSNWDNYQTESNGKILEILPSCVQQDETYLKKNKAIKIRLVLIFFAFLTHQLNAQDDVPELILSIENLYHANENTKLTRLYFFDDSHTIAFRYGIQFPKDLVLLSKSRLVRDSLNLRAKFGNGLTVHSIFQKSDSEIYIVHSFGTSEAKVTGNSLSLVSERLKPGIPPIDPEFLADHELIELGEFTIGYKVNPKKWLTSPDFWVYDWKKDRFAVYRDSEIPELSKNRYLKVGSTGVPEPFSTYNHFTYFISKTQDGFLFNLPLKNRFVIYNQDAGTMQGYTFPDLDKKSNAWFVLYDRHMNRYFPILQDNKTFKIYSLDQSLKKFQLLATTSEQPLDVDNGRVYIRKLLYKDKKEGWYFDHHLIDLYPKIK